jgi:hypothetical protein
MASAGFEALNKAGLQRLTRAQQVVFEELTPEELAVVTAIQERLNAAAPEVEAQESTNCLC